MRLIFHIGAGKTGTSSIQHTLAQNAEELRRQGYLYVGLMFEDSPTKRFPWQKAAASEQFHAMNAADTEAQLSEVLRATLDAARAAGQHTVIWSNESFFDRNQKVRGALLKLLAEGIDVRLVAYVRRHDAWIRSAYIQWGIKHKTYLGPLQPFRQWVEKRYPRFYPALAAVNEVFPQRVTVRNLDAVKDAVADFLGVCGIAPAGVKPARSNETPGGTEIFMRAIYNARFTEKVLPVNFERLIGRNTSFDHGPSAVLAQLLPTAADIAQIGTACAEDRAALNSMLASQDQPPIEETPLPDKRIDVDRDVLLKGLCELVLQQATSIRRLEKRLDELAAGHEKN